MSIAIGADHRGYKIKEKIKQYLNNYNIKDFGCFSDESVDYPDIGKEVAKNVSNGIIEKAILICGSGIGMSITANRFRSVRAALCRNEKDAEMSRKHNNSNILVLGADFIDEKIAAKIINTWMATDFEGGRHERRINKIDLNNKIITEVSASLLSSSENMTIEALSDFIKQLEACGIDSLHWDVMDGEYNPNNTWDHQGPDVIKKLRGKTNLPFVAHLMISNPTEKIELFHNAGCNTVVFHYEAYRNSDKIKQTISKIKSYKMSPGIAIEPDTPVKNIADYLPYVDLIVVMTVKTGFAGQGFMDMTEKIRYLDKIRKEKKIYFKITVDGGINNETGKLCKNAGADMLASASYIRNDYRNAIKSLRDLQ